MSTGNFPERARGLVFYHVKERLEKTDLHVTFGRDEVYVVSFYYVRGYWKALVSTSLPDGMYYEVTYDEAKAVTYIQSYKQWENVCIPDSKQPALSPTP